MSRLHVALLCGFVSFFILTPTSAEEILQTIPQPGSGAYSQYFGRSLVNVGDHHGDGHDDFIVGQPGYTGGGGSSYGQLHFFVGGPALYTQPLMTMYGPQWDGRLGWAVTALGDFNADGDPDFAASNPGGESPRVRVYFGGSELDHLVDLEMGTGLDYSWFGSVLSGGNDLNGDGHPDLAVGAGKDNSGTGQDGRVYVYFGGPDVDFYRDVELDAPMPAQGFGFNLALVPDVTNDGWDDLIVLNWDPASLLIYEGGPGFDHVPDFSLPLPEQGAYPDYYHPEITLPQIASGDLDGNGQPEIVVSLPLEAGGGEVWILAAGADLDTEVDATIQASAEGEYFGRMLDISGDYNGDGILDLLVGSRGAGAAHLSGFLHVYTGNDLGNLSPSLVMTDVVGNRRFGASATTMGDIDGDGDDELLVGSLSPFGYIWMVDELFFDGNENDIPDWDDGAEDCDDNLIPDWTQVLWQGQDNDGNLLVDACEIAQDPTLDCNGNGVLDSFEIDQYSSLDLDCDDDGVLDGCQLEADPGLDCDGDGKLDSCNIAQWPGLDCNEDGLLDGCQLAEDPSLDCDGDGVFDACQIAADHLLDSNQDQVLDYCEFPGRLSLYADAAYTHHELETDELGLVGPFYLVLNVPEGTADITHVELELVIPPELFGLQVDLNPLMGFDADNREEGLSLFFPAVAPDSAGNILIAEVWPIVSQPGVTGISLNIQGNFSNTGSSQFDLPLYSDVTQENRLITTTERGTLNGAISDVPPAENGYRLQVSNYPNPFNPRTTIRMELPAAGPARLEIVDLAGHTVKTFGVVADAPGSQSVQWFGRDHVGRQVASGVYFARLMQGNKGVQGKLVLLR